MKFIYILLLPFSLIYCFISYLKFYLSNPKKPPLPTISIGNLTMGGSGKTPITLALAKEFKECAIVLRGYKRESKGILVVSHNGKILTDVRKSGDEAMLYANSLPQASVIVSEDRLKGIKKAKELNAKMVFLDDGFFHFKIKKLNILIDPTPTPPSIFCIPSGVYRAPLWFKKYADIVLKEGVNFEREVLVLNETKRMVLVTAIANPARLDRFLPKNLVEKYYFEDHYLFKKEELEEIVKKHNATSLLVTSKDAVKLKSFNIELSLLNLEIKLPTFLKNSVSSYIDKEWEICLHNG